MNERLLSTMRFYLLATQLKYKIRSGWDKTHWNVSKERIESVAEHVYGTCILALSIYSNFEVNVDINKVIKMLVLHEIGEVIKRKFIKIWDVIIHLQSKKTMLHSRVKGVKKL